MIFKKFSDLTATVKASKNTVRVAVAGSHASHVLEAVIAAAKERIATPILFGDAVKTRELLRQLDADGMEFELHDCGTPEEAVLGAVHAIVNGRADFMMKGLVETGTMMKILLKRENNMRLEDSFVSALTIAELETYHKLIALTDGSISMPGDAQDKKKIIQNSVRAMKSMGWDRPKVAVLAAIEHINPKMPATVDAALLRQMYEEGEITGCVLEGPMAIDVALNREAAEIKGIESEISGDADLLLYPDLTSANIGIKTLIAVGHNLTGSVILGLRTPIVMSSRGSTTENKLRSLLLAASMV